MSKVLFIIFLHPFPYLLTSWLSPFLHLLSFFFGHAKGHAVMWDLPTRDQTHAPCIGSMEPWPLDYQGSSFILMLVVGCSFFFSLIMYDFSLSILIIFTQKKLFWCTEFIVFLFPTSLISAMIFLTPLFLTLGLIFSSFQYLKAKAEVFEIFFSLWYRYLVCKFLSKQCFKGLPQIWMYFIQFNILILHIFTFHLWSVGGFEVCAFVSWYLGDFPDISFIFF